jgi:hypothetical protein
MPYRKISYYSQEEDVIFRLDPEVLEEKINPKWVTVLELRCKEKRKEFFNRFSQCL